MSSISPLSSSPTPPQHQVVGDSHLDQSQEAPKQSELRPSSQRTPRKSATSVSSLDTAPRTSHARSLSQSGGAPKGLTRSQSEPVLGGGGSFDRVVDQLNSRQARQATPPPLPPRPMPPAPVAIGVQDINLRGDGLTYKSKDLHASDKAKKRVLKTVDGEIAKKALLKEKKVQNAKARKAKFDKFLKDAKGFFKNDGKLGKAVGEGARNLGETIVTQDGYRMGGGNSDSSSKLINEEVIKNHDVLPHLGEAAKGLAGAAAVLQMAETGSDYYLQAYKERDNLVNKQTVKKFVALQGQLDSAKKDLGLIEERITKATDEDPGADELPQLIEDRDQLKEKVGELSEQVRNSRMATKVAQQDVSKFRQNKNDERGKVIKSSLDGAKAAVDFSKIFVEAGSVAATGLGGASAGLAVVIGPITTVLDTRAAYKDIKDNRAAVQLKHQANRTIKDGLIQQDDAELISIAERIRLKQKKNSVEKGLSAGKNSLGAASGAVSAVGKNSLGAASGAVSAVAGVVSIVSMSTGYGAPAAAVATGISIGVAGTAATASIGHGCYKIARHQNSSQIKASLKGTIHLLQGKDESQTVGQLKVGKNLTEKEVQRLDRTTAKLCAALKREGDNRSGDELTVGELGDYAVKKLLARDTQTATRSLLLRMREEVAEWCGPENVGTLTEKDMDRYIKEQHDSLRYGGVITSGVGMVHQLGLELSSKDLLDLAQAPDSAGSSSVKFLSRKLKLA